MLKRNIKCIKKTNARLRIETILPMMEREKKQQEEILRSINDLENIQKISKNEVNKLTTAQVSLENYYTKEKKKVTEKLEKDITGVVNLWYANDYDFYIDTVQQRGKTYTTLMDRKRKGRLSVVCGGAVKQTLGVLFNFAFIRSVGSEFIFLDESFSSLGIDEINRLPEVFNILDDIQLVCIEHKCELIDSQYAVTVRISREVGEGSKIKIEDPNLLLKDSILEINNCSETDEDRELLIKFGYNLEEVRKYREENDTYSKKDRLDYEFLKPYI